MIQALQHGNYYHIYNRGINSETLFKEKEIKVFNLSPSSAVQAFEKIDPSTLL